MNLYRLPYHHALCHCWAGYRQPFITASDQQSFFLHTTSNHLILWVETFPQSRAGFQESSFPKGFGGGGCITEWLLYKSRLISLVFATFSRALIAVFWDKKIQDWKLMCNISGFSEDRFHWLTVLTAVMFFSIFSFITSSLTLKDHYFLKRLSWSAI